VQALTARAEDRLLFALLTHPAPDHQSPALDRFAAAFRRPPAAAHPPDPCPPLDLEEFAVRIRALAAEELEWSAPSFEPVASVETPDEIARQTAEALWQSLLFDLGA
jgi:hypothetical protein